MVLSISLIGIEDREVAMLVSSSGVAKERKRQKGVVMLAISLRVAKERKQR